ncbi:PKD domain-containing protein [Kiritimatiella glycovorans]|nr:PKD domain-containing protein [Kiritimatiella glycovorans]
MTKHRPFKKRRDRARRVSSAFFVIVLLSMLTATTAARAVPVTWSEPEAEFRLLLVLRGNTRWPAKAGFVSFCTSPYRPETSAFTVRRLDGVPVGTRRLWVRDGEPVKLMFDTSSGERSYYLYIGPKDRLEEKSFEPQSGVILETRPAHAFRIGSVDQFRKVWEAAGEPYGRSVVPKIFDGINRFGPSTEFMSRYRGWFELKEKGAYEIATVADDLAFVLIDGRTVVEWPRGKNLWRHRSGEVHAEVELDKGVHEIEYLHLQQHHRSVAMTAWRKKGADRFHLMQDGVYRPVAHFDPSAWMAADPDRQPGLVTWRIVDSLELDDRAVVRAEFRVRPEDEDLRYRWTFDDGTVVDGAAVTHIFLRPGRRRFRLQGLDGRWTEQEWKGTVRVHRRWEERFRWNEEIFDALRPHLMERDLASLPVEDFTYFMEWASSAHDLELLGRSVDEARRRADGLKRDAPEALLRIGAYYARARKHEYEEAEQWFRTVIGLDSAPAPLKDRARLELGALLLKAYGKPQEAQQVLKAVRPPHLSNRLQRRLRFLDAERLLIAGDTGRAREAFERLAAGTRMDSRSVLRRRATAQEAAAALDEGLTEEALDRMRGLMLEDPRERLDLDRIDLLRRIYLRSGDLLRARVLCASSLPLAVSDRERSELLYALADVYDRMGREDRARETARRIIDEYPYSAAASRAAGRWK